ncbi:MAG: hypothetical protein CVU62_10950 [Deltaproteobacteria bacterium HGW-Deltaproteobacteria-2]|nr:MAG: hypothetical protein CVU62_10950 [Deltaproteobacteria bacterium HGW-Deltaproteobacteria-2]
MKNNLSLKVISFFALLFIMAGNAKLVYAEIQDGSIARVKLRKEVRALLHEEKFSELENMANKFRTEKTRFPDGGWKVHSFHAAFASHYYGWDELLGNLDKWMKMYPNSVTAKVAAGRAWVEYAWAARGGGYANTVKEEGWKLFEERTAKAYELVKNPPEDLSKDCVERYYVLLIIARAQGWDKHKYEALFKKAVSYEPSYYAYYLEKAYDLLPRWHGEKGDWQKFADEAVKLTPKSEGMGIYALILLKAWDLKEFTEFREPDISWQKMRQGFIDIERNYPNSPYMLNFFCRLACIASDKETAIELFKRIGDEPYTEAWQGRSNFYKWQKWAGMSE